MVEIKFFGEAGFEMTTGKGLKIVIDPWITENPLCPITVDDVKEADIVLVSHSAFDHLGITPTPSRFETWEGTTRGPRKPGPQKVTYDAFEIVKKTGAFLVGPEDVCALASVNGVSTEKIKRAWWGSTTTLEGIQIQGVKAIHTTTMQQLFCQGFNITLEDNTRIYHSGDTHPFLDLKYDVGELFHPNIMMFESGPVSPAFGMGYNAFEIAEVVRWIGPDVFIPIHDDYHLFSPKITELVNIAAPYIKVVTMKPGDALQYKPFQLELKTQTAKKH